MRELNSVRNTLKRFLFVPLLVLTACAVMTACAGDDSADISTSSDEGSGSDESSGGNAGDSGDRIELSVDICTLGADEITAMLEAVDPRGNGEASCAEVPESETAGFGPKCIWTGPYSSELSVSVSKYSDWFAIEDFPSDSDIVEVPGLGEEAHIDGDGQQIAWRRDDISVRVDGDRNLVEGALLDLAEQIDADLQASGT